ncbi:alpha/beta hydrolase [uncultured Paraglaciecola sp.]|uniref:alpha/beta fold hydrolase n=1 Tax=uncultured Paraglaciecola sp. TaxID=1765024 RepID=UPI0030D92B8D|tara:strand:+ start:4082 stop:4891 length:810 start_codon:yes stop_codon:yes gene_type:complete
MTKSTKINLHFAHANGFPAGSYQQIFKQFPDDFTVHALTKFAHSERFPVNANLENQVAELIDYLTHTVGHPAYVVGHSMGAVVSFVAACERPDLIKGVIMLDPPIASGVARVAFRLLKYSPLIDKFSPAGKAKVRCQSWPLGTDLVAYFKAKALFKNFQLACIQDYVDAAIDEREDKLQLNFDAQIEASIYRNVPHNLNKFYKRLSVPGLLVTGSQSDVCIPAFLATFIKKSKIEHHVFEGGGHMFPLESPKQVAELITNRIRLWESEI